MSIKRMQSDQTTRCARGLAADVSVEAVEKPVDNFFVLKTGAESAMKLCLQRFMTLIFAYRRVFPANFMQNLGLYVFLQPRYISYD